MSFPFSDMMLSICSFVSPMSSKNLRFIYSPFSLRFLRGCIPAVDSFTTSRSFLHKNSMHFCTLMTIYDFSFAIRHSPSFRVHPFFSFFVPFFPFPLHAIFLTSYYCGSDNRGLIDFCISIFPLMIS